MTEQNRHLRICLLYDFKQGKTAAESHRCLVQAFGEEAFSESQCRFWFHRFREGNLSLDDIEHNRRPPVVDNDLLRSQIESDPCQSTRQLASAFHCSNSTIAEHLHSIGKVNRCGKWVPHVLSDANKAARVTISGILISRSKTTGFLDSIVTSDEKWIQYENTNLKRQWLNPGERPKPTPKPDIHGKKAMLCIWWNFKGLVYMDILEAGQTVTADIYKEQLTKVDLALRRQGVDTSSTKFLHDNARPHSAKITQQKIDELGWEVLPHAPYSPDLAPSDFHLFRSMQHALDGQHFKSHDEIKLWVAHFCDSQPEEFYRRGIHSLRSRWTKVIEGDGEYLLD